MPTPSYTSLAYQQQQQSWFDLASFHSKVQGQGGDGTRSVALPSIYQPPTCNVGAALLSFFDMGSEMNRHEDILNGEFRWWKAVSVWTRGVNEWRRGLPRNILRTLSIGSLPTYPSDPPPAPKKLIQNT
ncbi:hypothetical protein J1614_004893 [Plenodomus biglobosus]|nr:hypothetical protein J1614_004893 [Plenodomus biglobosus]